MYNIQAVYSLYPNVVSTHNTTAYDANGNVVQTDANAIIAKAAELQAAEAQAEQAQATAKASALAKLTALGLTADEVKALLGA